MKKKIVTILLVFTMMFSLIGVTATEPCPPEPRNGGGEANNNDGHAGYTDRLGCTMSYGGIEGVRISITDENGNRVSGTRSEDFIWQWSSTVNRYADSNHVHVIKNNTTSNGKADKFEALYSGEAFDTLDNIKRFVRAV